MVENWRSNFIFYKSSISKSTTDISQKKDKKRKERKKERKKDWSFVMVVCNEKDNIHIDRELFKWNNDDNSTNSYDVGWNNNDDEEEEEEEGEEVGGWFAIKDSEIFSMNRQIDFKRYIYVLFIILII